MAKDLMRMLTEITPTQQPVAGTPGFRGMFGQQQAQRLQGSLGSLARGGAPSAQARMGQALAGLDLNNPEDLAKLAKIQQGTGDLAGAAKTAAQMRELAEKKAIKDALDKQRKQLVTSATTLGLNSTVESLQSGGSLEEAQKTIYEEQQRNMVNKGGRRGKVAVAKSKNADPKLIARINAGDFDEMSDTLFIEQLEGKKATIKAFTNAEGQIESRRVDESANVWNPTSSRWESPMDLGLRPAPVVTKQISAADGITSKLTGKMLDNFLELNDEARNSLKILGTNQESIAALNNAIEPGFTGDLKLELMRIGKAAGIIPEDMTDKVAATELFLKQRNSQVLPLIKNLGTGTAVSDNDVKFIKDIVGASVTLEDETIRSIIAIQNQGALDSIRLNNEALERLNTVEGTQLDQSVYQSLYIQPPKVGSPMPTVLSNRAQNYLNRIK